MRDRDRFRDCLIGGAAGDALGYEIEFQSEQQILSRYGERGITEYALHDGKALISDDTQMTLFTATGLLCAAAQGKTGGTAREYERYFRESYLDWLKTQTESFPLPEGEHSSWLVNVPGLFSRRAPGNTCMSALYSARKGPVRKPVNLSKGCGGVMRAAPVGLFFCDRGMQAEDVARIGAEAAAVTHGHIMGWMPAAAFAQIVYEISQNGDPVYDAVMKTLHTQETMWPGSEEKDSFLELMQRAASLASSGMKDAEAIHRLGEGWVADEALAIAVLCALRYPDDFDRAIIAAVNHKGDSDSTGAIAGNILGASLGLEGIPGKYTKDLELKEVILEVADDLWRGCRADGTEDSCGAGIPEETREIR